MRRVSAAVVAVALLVWPVAADAQTAAGFRVGYRSSGLETTQTVSALEELAYGVYVGFGLSDRMAFQIEAVYGTRGADGLGLGTDALDATATPSRVDMTYLEVPLLLRIGFPTDRVLPSFFAGPYAGILLSCDVTPDGGSATACDDDGATQRFTPRSTELGVLAGAGLDLALGEATVFVDARLTLGLLSIESGSNGFDARHSGATVSAGLAVPLGQ